MRATCWTSRNRRDRLHTRGFSSAASATRKLSATATRPEAEQADLTKPYDPESDAVRGKNWQYLTYEQKERFKQHFTPEELSRINLDDVKLHIGDRRWYMPGKMDGMVVDNHIYINPEVSNNSNGLDPFDPANNADHFGLLAHELTHVGQFQNGMTRPGYLFQGLINGYRDNPYEKEARSHERAQYGFTESNLDK